MKVGSRARHEFIVPFLEGKDQSKFAVLMVYASCVIFFQERLKSE